MFTQKSCTVHNLKMLLPWCISVSLPRIKSLSDNHGGIGISNSSRGGRINWIQKYLVGRERMGISGVIKEIFCIHLQRYYWKHSSFSIWFFFFYLRPPENFQNVVSVWNILLLPCFSWKVCVEKNICGMVTLKQAWPTSKKRKGTFSTSLQEM